MSDDSDDTDPRDDGLALALLALLLEAGEGGLTAEESLRRSARWRATDDRTAHQFCIPRRSR
jgi:hypothetical protein